MALRILFLLSLFTFSVAHSTLGEPKPIVPRICRLGGTPLGGFTTCPGPCDVRTFGIKQRNATSPKNPSRIYRRGQIVPIKYHRNNHGPGGFVRLTLVPIHKMMDKKVHAANAFHYSCWGAVAVPAKKNERGSDKAGFSLVGGDGKLHNLPISYYQVNVKIPTVIPDGNYVLGYVWYGGLGGTIYGNTVDSPYPYGYFADYWSCSYVRVQGGAALQNKVFPAFDNNVKKFWGDGCMSASDAPGQCSFEPCKRVAEIQKPKEFKDGSKPKALTPKNFQGPKGLNDREEDIIPIPTAVPDHMVLRSALKVLYRTKKVLWAKIYKNHSAKN